MDRPVNASIEDRGGRRSVERVLADDAAFRAWYDAALPRVFGYLYGRTGRNHDLAEELTQQVFVEAVRSRARVTGDDDVAWLVGIARHRLADHLRRLERRERGFLRLVARTEPPVTWIGQPGDGDLATALAALPPAQRAALTFRYVDDLPVREVARLLGRSEGAVESLLSRGRETLHRRLGGERR